ncbi:MAG: hypothetical protein CSA23_01955 [Deltaproteobacteria bacterium]|nr:MAG: hypothetical protein CSA23_01955 [Deltaproteobacteria bacterium]
MNVRGWGLAGNRQQQNIMRMFLLDVNMFRVLLHRGTKRQIRKPCAFASWMRGNVILFRHFKHSQDVASALLPGT